MCQCAGWTALAVDLRNPLWLLLLSLGVYFAHLLALALGLLALLSMAVASGMPLRRYLGLALACAASLLLLLLTRPALAAGWCPFPPASKASSLTWTRRSEDLYTDEHEKKDEKGSCFLIDPYHSASHHFRAN